MSSALRGAPLPNTAIEIAHVEMVIVAPADAGPHGCGVPVPGLLTVPIHWTTRDAVAIVIDSGGEALQMRERLLNGLLADGAAILEINVKDCRPRDTAGSTGAPSARQPADPLATLLGALLVLRRDYSAGLVVAIGFGQDGDAVLDASVGAERPETPGRHLNARILLSPGVVRFIPGAIPPAKENWLHRAELLCAILATAAASSAGSDRRAVQVLERSCVASLPASRLNSSNTLATDVRR